MTEIVYLHGFNTDFDPENEKVAALSRIGVVHGISYDSYSSYGKIRAHLIVEIGKIDCSFTNILIVGTSLGGFWASEMAAVFGCPSVIINPLCAPTDIMRRYIGDDINYKMKEKRLLTSEACESYGDMRIQNNPRLLYRPLALLDLGDDVIDARISSEILRKEKFIVVEYQGGSHGFEHIEKALEEIKIYLIYCSFVKKLNI